MDESKQHKNLAAALLWETVELVTNDKLIYTEGESSCYISILVM